MGKDFTNAKAGELWRLMVAGCPYVCFVTENEEGDKAFVFWSGGTMPINDPSIEYGSRVVGLNYNSTKHPVITEYKV